MNKYRLILALGVVFVSSAAILIRLADAPPMVIAAYRLGISALVIAPIALLHSGKRIIRLRISDILLASLSGFFLALHFGLWITSLDYTSVASSVVLVTSSPVFVAIISYWLFQEQLSAMVITGIIICFIGTGIIGAVNWDTGSIHLLGAILAFLGAIAVSGYMLIGRILRQKMELLSYIFLTYSISGIVLLLAVLVMRIPLSGYSGETYLMFVLLAFVPQILGHSALNWSLRYISATLITIAILGEPVIATVMAYFILGESPKVTEIIGGLIILGGIYLAFRKTPVRETEKSAEYPAGPAN